MLTKYSAAFDGLRAAQRAQGRTAASAASLTVLIL